MTRALVLLEKNRLRASKCWAEKGGPWRPAPCSRFWGHLTFGPFRVEEVSLVHLHLDPHQGRPRQPSGLPSRWVSHSMATIPFTPTCWLRLWGLPALSCLHGRWLKTGVSRLGELQSPPQPSPCHYDPQPHCVHMHGGASVGRTGEPCGCSRHLPAFVPPPLNDAVLMIPHPRKLMGSSGEAWREKFWLEKFSKHHGIRDTHVGRDPRGTPGITKEAPLQSVSSM